MNLNNNVLLKSILRQHTLTGVVLPRLLLCVCCDEAVRLTATAVVSRRNSSMSVRLKSGDEGKWASEEPLLAAEWDSRVGTGPR